MIRVTGNRIELALGFPRVSGDDPDHANASPRALTFSPRERG